MQKSWTHFANRAEKYDALCIAVGYGKSFLESSATSEAGSFLLATPQWRAEVKGCGYLHTAPGGIRFNSTCMYRVVKVKIWVMCQ